MTAAGAAPAADPAAPPAFNPDDYTIEELRTIAESGVFPDSPPAPAAAPPDEEGVEVPDPPADDPEAPPAVPPEEGVEPEAPEAPAPFTFTEDADLPTFLEESDAYLATVELTPEAETIINRLRTEAETARTRLATYDELGGDALATRALTALNEFVTFKEDPETNRFVPKSEALISLLESEYPQELPQFEMDLLSRPSKKYQGLTVMQEKLRDYANLDDRAMAHLDEFLHNGGRFQTPTFVPDGVNPKVSEAFWIAPDREQLQLSLNEAVDIIGDELSSAEAKLNAKREIVQINARLEQVQAGIDADKQRQQQVQQQLERDSEEVNQQIGAAYIETSLGMMNNLADKAAKALTMLDPQGAKITSFAYASMVKDALLDSSDYSRAAQKQLTDMGIRFDWGRGRAALDTLFDAEKKIVEQTRMKANAHAIEISRREKAKALGVLQGLETDLIGKLVAAVVGSGKKQLHQQIAAAPKIPAVRPKDAQKRSAAAPREATPNFDTMSREELQSRIGQLRREGGFLP